METQSAIEATTPRERRSPKTPDLENIEVRQHGATSFVAGFDMDGARFHLWIDGVTLQHTGTLYKNPPLRVERGTPGHFEPKSLNPAAKAHAPVVAELFATIERDGLIAKARAAAVAEKAAEAEQERLAEIAELKCSAGVELYASLFELVNSPNAKANAMWDRARASLKLAENGKSEAAQ